MLQFFQSFCSGSSCARHSDPSSAPVWPQGAKDSSGGSFLDALTLKPSVVDDGELQFPPRSQVRPRGSSNPRQKSAGRTVSKSQNSYAGADFQDLPNASLHWQSSDWKEAQVHASSHRNS
ncbi:unnamed protein product [Cladocopium goreaui]|uniref:Tic20 family protein n=1 Tax=Cladocopium goreaui TaxID=2562237 RepID=A0A9P1FZX4_9DINO|nr:unnamed protein product [Cladocopium goreaui]|mmetsp:Transcript_29200/g.63464  ORF Transcript_29200/g.63464 Transcript_29200/m.63464 type:complete len:120 (-) Transcript_29200:79-438(-)